MPDPDVIMSGIVQRFDTDIQRIGTDVLHDAFLAWQYGDFTIVQETIDAAAEDAQYRIDLAVDSAAWQGFEVGRVDAMVAADSMIAWELEPLAEHCPTCLDFAAGGPYTIDNLPGIPGDADTECDGSCRCNLIPIGG